MIDDLLSKILDDLDHVRRAAGALMAQTAQRKMDRATIMASTDRANGGAQMAIMRVGQVVDCVLEMTARIAALEAAIEAQRSELSKIADAADCGKLDSGRFAFAIDDVRDALDEALENDD